MTISTSINPLTTKLHRKEDQHGDDDAITTRSRDVANFHNSTSIIHITTKLNRKGDQHALILTSR